MELSTVAAGAATHDDLLPSSVPVQLLEADGRPAHDVDHDYAMPATPELVELYTAMVLGRRLDEQATALTKQGRLAVYPSARGQEACQLAAVRCLRPTDWVFPTYRESMALFGRGIEPAQVLTLLQGSWHSGYDPAQVRAAPQCTPLATQNVHAVGFAAGEARQGRDTIAMAFSGDGATSEGDFHEALNFAAVFRAPVVFFVQNNKYAISVPLARQSVAPSLAHKGIGYGIPGEQVDGNDPAAVLAVLSRAVEHARSGRGPFLVEAHTYRLEAHTNADDARRYRDDAEVQEWLERDPVVRLEAYLRDVGALDDDQVAATRERADAAAARLRDCMNAEPALDPLELFDHVYATPTAQLLEQRAVLAQEIADEQAAHQDGSVG
jgi:pyruvate dehydrogenase E1 component alpha subunit